jgi:hypothetical protein
VPDPVLARCSITAHSAALGRSMSTGCALILDRPGRGHLAVLGPFGGTLVTGQTDGADLAVSMPRMGRFLAGDDVAARLAEATGNAVSVDDVLGLLVGDVPPTAGTDKDSRVSVDLDEATATPTGLRVIGADGAVVVEAVYGPFAEDDDGTWWPADVQLTFADVGLTLDLTYKSWSTPEPVPEVFGQMAPPGMHTEDLWAAIRSAATMFLGVP